MNGIFRIILNTQDVSESYSLKREDLSYSLPEIGNADSNVLHRAGRNKPSSASTETGLIHGWSIELSMIYATMLRQLTEGLCQRNSVLILILLF